MGNQLDKFKQTDGGVSDTNKGLKRQILLKTSKKRNL